MKQISNEKLKLLVEQLDIVPKERLDAAYVVAEKNKRPLSDVLIESDLISDDHLGDIISKELGFEFIDLDKVAIDKEVLAIVPKVMAQKQKVIVFDRNEKEGVKVAMVNPGNLAIINLIEKKTGQPVQVYYTTPDNIISSLRHYQKGLQSEFTEIIQENVSQAKQGGAKAEDAPIIKIVDTIIEYAFENKSSDIHIEPSEEKTLIRFRIDGILHDIIDVPAAMHDQIITRIKIMSKLRTDEHRSAQDGKLRAKVHKEKLDLRVSIIPIVEGEKVVLRLLSDHNRQMSLEDLGMSAPDLMKVKQEYNKPWGMIVATGPTGAGKSTTLYAIIKVLNKREVNISTIEDPVEYDMDNVNQIQVNAKTNLTFANGLRSILRQDPDIIMVGEIRDEETADIAVNASMTGHLVLTSLHTNDAPTALPRFLEMSLEPFLIASTVNLVMAQRLVRKNCDQCVASFQVTKDELKQKFSAPIIDKHFTDDKQSIRIYHGKGCPLCSNTGYRGRLAIFEVMPVTEPLRALIMRRANADEIRNQAMKEGMTTMIEDGINKVLAGVTTLEEVLRATRA